MKLNTKWGMTLVETALSLALAGIVLVTLANVVEISKDNWRMNTGRLEMLRETRRAIHRMSAELRYSTRLLQAESTTHSYLEFETTNLVDDDTGVEVIMFSRLSGNGALYRQVDGGSSYALAGEPFDYPQVQSFTIIPLKLDVSNDLVPLTGGDTLDVDAVAVQLDFTMVDDQGLNLGVSTVVHMRNKT